MFYVDEMFVIVYCQDRYVLRGKIVFVVYCYDRSVLHGSNVCCSLLV